jgi:hypothetical protein
MKIADLHIHSSLSDGVRSPENIVDFAENMKVLDKIYITDHDNIDGSLRARDHALKHNYNIDIGIGSEISSEDCHVVALGIKHNIKKGRSVIDTAQDIISDGGFPIIAHPFNPFFRLRHIPGESIVKLLQKEKIPFAIEVNGSLNYQTIPYKNRKILNKTVSISRSNLSTINLANKYNVTIVGASDAHMLRAIGSAYTLYEDDLVYDIKSNKVSYGFIFADRRESMPYIGYHMLFDPIPINMLYKRKFLNIIPKAKNKKN